MSELANQFEQAMADGGQAPAPIPEFDRMLHVEFFEEVKLDIEASREAGAAVNKPVLFVKIFTPGERDTVIHKFFDKSYHRGHPWAPFNRFASQYQRWLANKETPEEGGTPLEALTRVFPPVLDEAEVENYKFWKVNTAEQLLAIPEGSSGKFFAFQTVRARVQRYLDKQKGEVPQAKLELALQEKENRIAALEAQMEALVKAQASKPVPGAPAPIQVQMVQPDPMQMAPTREQEIADFRSQVGGNEAKRKK